MSYSPTLGRWTQTDPTGYADGSNLYEGLVSNPITNLDPVGTQATKPAIDPKQDYGGAGTGLSMPPVFKGFEDPRYQQHDGLIAELVDEFNRNKQGRTGCTAEQAAKIPDITPAMVKSWLIQESGGNDARSRAAWDVDPAQVNVPGDWGEGKADLGLKPPTNRNEGNARDNIRAAIPFLARKGFARSGVAPGNRPSSFFDDWPTAFARYNGRNEVCENGKPYSQNYSDRIMDRANNPGVNYGIGLPRPRR
jgi:hypothetical protein